MKQLYGTSFVTIYGDVPAPLWLQAIDGLSEAQCRRGLSVLAGEKRSYPANLTEFVAACRPNGSPRFLGVPTSPAELQRLKPPPARRDHVDRCLARMRAALREAGA